MSYHAHGARRLLPVFGLRCMSYHGCPMVMIFNVYSYPIYRPQTQTHSRLLFGLLLSYSCPLSGGKPVIQSWTHHLQVLERVQLVIIFRFWSPLQSGLYLSIAPLLRI